MKKKRYLKRCLVLWMVFSMMFTSVDLGSFVSYATEESEQEMTIFETEGFTEEATETEITSETEIPTETETETSTEFESEEFTEAETEEVTEPEGEVSAEEEEIQTIVDSNVFIEARAGGRYVGSFSESKIHNAIHSETLGWTGRIFHWSIDGDPGLCLAKGVNTPANGTEMIRYDGNSVDTKIRKALAWYESSAKNTIATLTAQFYTWAVQAGVDPLRTVEEAIVDYYTKEGWEDNIEYAIPQARSMVQAIERATPTDAYTWKLPGYQVIITTTKTPGTWKENPPEPTEPPTEPTNPPTEPEVQPEYASVGASASRTANRLHEINIDDKYADVTGEKLAGAVFEVFEDGVSRGTITTDEYGKGSLSWTLSVSKSSSAERTYCSNYDQLSDAMKATVGGYKNRDEAYNSALAEAERNAQAQAEADADRERVITVKEITVPEGFNPTSDSEQKPKLAGNDSETIHVENEPWKAKLTLDKVDGVTGGRLTEAAEFIIYEWDGNQYAPSLNYQMIRLEDGTYTAANNYPDGELGYLYYTQCNRGFFGVQEVSAPEGYIKENEIYYFRITEDNQLIKAHNMHPENYLIHDETKWANQPAHVQIEIPKIDRYSGNGIVADAKFEVYAKEGSVSAPVTFTKREDGSYLSSEVYYENTFNNANFGFFYTIEKEAPDGYYGDWADENGNKANGSEDNKVRYEFAVFGDLTNHDSIITITNDEAGKNFFNEHQYGAVDLYKFDDEAEDNYAEGDRITQGDADTLDGAVYGLYANEDIYHPDGVTGLLHRKNDLVATGTIGQTPVADSWGYVLDTDGNRCIESGKEPQMTVTPGATGFRQVELGHYYVSEITPADGYLSDTVDHRGEELTKYYVSFEYQGEFKSVIVRKETAMDDGNNLVMDDSFVTSDIYSGDFVFKQGAEFIKLEDTNTDTEKDPIKAGFSIYRIATLEGVADGTIAPEGEVWTTDDMMKFVNYDFRKDSTALLYKRDSETWTEGDKAWLVPTGERKNEYRVSEMFSDEVTGYFCTPELPVGQYVMVESTVPEGKKQADPVLVTITKDSAMPQPVRYVGDETTQTYIRIQKKDNDCIEDEFNTVLKPGAKYRIRLLSDKKEFDTEMWNIDSDGYLWYYNPTLDVKQGTEEAPFAIKCIYRDGKIIDAYIELDQMLPVGEYEVTEVGVPDGFVLNGSEEKLTDTSSHTKNLYEITADPWEKTTFTIDNAAVYPDGQWGANKFINRDEYGRLIVTITQENKEQKGIVEITKFGEQLFGADITTERVFEYELAPVREATFEIYAAEDIYTGQVDKELLDQYAEDVTHYLVHHKDDLIGTITTDDTGFAYLADLYLGKYYIKEVVAGDGFVLSTYVDEFEITSAEPEKNFILYESSYENERQKVEVIITKRDAGTGKTVQGAVFGLYNKEEIVSYIKQETEGNFVLDKEGRKLLSADTLIATAESDKDGQAHFMADLPLGEYYVLELEAPDGYYSSEEIIEVDASYAGQDVSVVKQTFDFLNEKKPHTPENPVPEETIPEKPVGPSENVIESPQTGDSTVILYVAITSLLALFAFLFIAAWLEKRKE